MCLTETRRIIFLNFVQKTHRENNKLLSHKGKHVEKHMYSPDSCFRVTLLLNPFHVIRLRQNTLEEFHAIFAIFPPSPITTDMSTFLTSLLVFIFSV